MSHEIYRYVLTFLVDEFLYTRHKETHTVSKNPRAGTWWC